MPLPLPAASAPCLAPADPVADLAARRTTVQAALRAAAEAPVRHVPAALLDALQGSWGTPEEVLGVASGRPRLAAAR